MNRSGFRKLLIERGVYSDARSAPCLNKLMEMQYYATKKLVKGLITSSAPLTSELVSSTAQNLFEKKIFLNDRDLSLSVNSQQFPELRNVHVPPVAEQLKYEYVKSDTVVQTTTSTAPTTETTGDGSEDAIYAGKRAKRQVEFISSSSTQAGQGPVTTDFVGSVSNSDDEDGGDRKRIRL